MKEHHYIPNVGLLRCSSTQQEGLRQLEACYLVLVSPFYDGQPAVERRARVGQDFDRSRIQLDYRIRAGFFGVAPNIRSFG